MLPKHWKMVSAEIYLCCLPKTCVALLIANLPSRGGAVGTEAWLSHGSTLRDKEL